MKFTQAFFTPFTTKNLHLSNRIVMAPMTRYKSANGVPDATVANYYRRRAEGGIGLIITEGTVIGHSASQDHANVPHFYGDIALAGWQKVVHQVHAAGGKIFPQLWHVGSVRQTGTPPDFFVPGHGPSAIIHPGAKNQELPKEMTQKDIDEVIAAFALAAKNAKQLGFDGLEIHGAHGYLIDQFFWSYTNRRSDQYGGKKLYQRTRFAVEIIKAIRAEIGEEFPISFRFSQWKMGAYEAKLAQTPQELETFLLPLTAAGVDIFHCSTRRFYEPEFSDSSLNLAGWTKKITGKATMTVGSVGLNNDFVSDLKQNHPAQPDLENFKKILSGLENQEYDLVVVGRALLADPQWLQKISEKRFAEIKKFTKESLQELY